MLVDYEYFKAFLKERKLSINKLAEDAELSAKTLQRMARGEMSRKTSEKILKVFEGCRYEEVFGEMNYVSRDGYCFEIVWKWGCDGVVIDKVNGNVVLESLWLEDIVFNSWERAKTCLEGFQHIGLFYEDEAYGGYCSPECSPTTVTFNDRFNLYEFADGEGRVAMARLVPRTVILWED